MNIQDSIIQLTKRGFKVLPVGNERYSVTKDEMPVLGGDPLLDDDFYLTPQAVRTLELGIRLSSHFPLIETPPQPRRIGVFTNH